MKLEAKELINIRGGGSGLKYAIIVGIGGLITFVVGLIDGYINPLKCNKAK